MNIPYVNLALQHRRIKHELLHAVENVLEHGQFIMGPELNALEQQFADQWGASFACGVNSGTDALFLSMKALGIGPGDEVITVPNSFVATATAIMLTGAWPVFVDVGNDMNIDTDLLDTALTEHTKAILPVHLTGRPAEMDSILETAEKYGLYVIEDCAQAVGAEYGSQPVGTFGICGCFSFHPLKNLNACGDGGMVVSDDGAFMERLRMLRNIGMKSRDNVELAGHNSRLDTLQAALLLAKLPYLKTWTDARRSNAQQYREGLAGIEPLVLPPEEHDMKAVYHTFVVRTERRDSLKAYLAERGVGTAVHYPVPIHLQPAFRSLGYGVGDFPVCERQSRTILSLPVYPELAEKEIRWIIQCIRSFYANASSE